MKGIQDDFSEMLLIWINQRIKKATLIEVNYKKSLNEDTFISQTSF